MSSMRSFDEALQAVSAVDGWMSPDQAERLYRAAAGTHRGDIIVEIGSFRGRSTIVLASAAPEGVQIVAIDPHAGNDRGPQELDGFEAAAATDHDVFNANLAAAGVAHRVHHVRAFSDAAHGEVAGVVAVLYVDGAHRYAPARTDIRDWGRRVAPGGTLLIHDSFSSVGVTLAIMRELMLVAAGATWAVPVRSPSTAPTSTAVGPVGWAMPAGNCCSCRGSSRTCSSRCSSAASSVGC